MSMVVETKDFVLAIKRYGEKAEAQIARAVRVTAVGVLAHTKKSIQGGNPKGRIYYRKKIRHQASKAGQPPASDTGRLAGSIYMVISNNKLGALVGTDVPYGAYLEHGTRNIKPRPWLRPAIEKRRKGFFKAVDIAVNGTKQKEL